MGQFVSGLCKKRQLVGVVVESCVVITCTLSCHTCVTHLVIVEEVVFAIRVWLFPLSREVWIVLSVVVVIWVEVVPRVVFRLVARFQPIL